MQKQPLRPHHRDGRLLRYKLRRLERGGDDLVPPPLHDARDEPELLRLRGGEGPRGEGELVHEALVPGHFGHAREGADVCCEADVDFLSICIQVVSCEM